MHTLKILNSKDTKKIIQSLKEQYGIKGLKLDYVFFKSDKQKIYILSKKFKDLNSEKIRINSLGLYFCKIENDGIRLTIDGAQMIGKSSNKNVIKINEEQAKEWMSGKGIQVSEKACGYALLEKNKDFLGAGKYKDGKILNYVPRDRRIKS